MKLGKGLYPVKRGVWVVTGRPFGVVTEESVVVYVPPTVTVNEPGGEVSNDYVKISIVMS